ncbi:ABC-2 type transport system permease protein [Paucibacter oligotrophus]|uniref:ABC-2 type transport system permease protein n=1 Tax=Roseateles oligotrophus TaxID=1769250 RepID=A0A840LDU6_9BURK|nr:ABC transporter permease [Roseateles oligotrophus]MBB4843497.1 ABC-2 type transport system permease protein [Roseateles oligotrophus]
MAAQPLSWLGWLRATLASALRDQGALLMLVAAPIIYSFFYPWPYATQALQRVPVAIVDQDHSNLSRQIIRFAQASPRLQLRLVSGDEAEVQALMAGREIEGYLLLPPQLKRDVARGQGVVLPVLANGAYFLTNKVVLSGFGEVLGTVSAGVELKQLQARGQPPLQAAQSRSPLNLRLLPLYNLSEGYGSYVVPAVAVLIIQQLLLIGTALWVGTWFEQPRTEKNADSLWAWSARTAAFALFGLLSAGWFFGLTFPFLGYAHGGNPFGTALLLLPFCWGVAALGVALGALFADRERAMQALLCTSLPIAFLAGFSWPRESLPAALQTLGEAIPAVIGIQAFVRLNQMGAPLEGVASYGWALLAQALGFSLLAAWAVGRRSKAATLSRARQAPKAP